MSGPSQTTATGSVLLFLFAILAIPAWVASVIASAQASRWGSLTFALMLPVACAVVGAVLEACWFVLRGRRWP
jgi:hypothetical protein